VVVACYRVGPTPVDLAAAARRVAIELAPAKRPKHYLPLASWPRNEQGKLNRPELAAQAAAAMRALTRPDA
jgi:acyl-CoA synthetase (AMP-forming)/AMP-acid ligase II